MEIIGRSPSGIKGQYFRVNAWAWPTLLALLRYANTQKGLGFDLNGLDEGCSAGLTEQETETLSVAMSETLKDGWELAPANGSVLIKKEAGIYLDDGKSYMDTKTGQFVKANFKGPKHPANNVAYTEVNKFIGFLQVCGGFIVSSRGSR